MGVETPEPVASSTRFRPILGGDAYLTRVVFYKERSFSREQFRDFMFAQWQAHEDMIQLVRALRGYRGLRVDVISNEGRELAEFRNRKFGVTECIDFFIYPSFVHFRKPDEDIYRVALDVSQTPPELSVYVEDRAMLVDVARGLGMHGIVHTGIESTRKALAELGLTPAR